MCVPKHIHSLPLHVCRSTSCLVQKWLQSSGSRCELDSVREDGQSLGSYSLGGGGGRGRKRDAGGRENYEVNERDVFIGITLKRLFDLRANVTCCQEASERISL